VSIDPKITAATLEAVLCLPPGAIGIEYVEDCAWEREWLKDFRPMRFGKKLWVSPAGQLPDQTAEVVLELDPGLAFGTGTHATTALCLEWLDDGIKGGERVLDYGCGSGILAIAAARLGASRVAGVDIDPQAVAASRYNAQRNGVEARFSGADDPRPEPADVVVANILSNPLKVLAPLLAELVLPGGHIVLSGILQPQADAVAAEYVRWFDIDPFSEREGWVRVSGVRRS
ncbi:MAG TPA: 50S ribosomal protein L11 methyltransferase, partial [Burkholderiales bacterium]|nr:50S ribosomal protein L11 methyltransferase [Burkholderiales bacterium]